MKLKQKTINEIRRQAGINREISNNQIEEAYKNSLYAASMQLGFAVDELKKLMAEDFRPLTKIIRNILK